MKRFDVLYRNLFAVYGPQHWWPAHTDFEVIAGAVLTQNTAWINVEPALLNLREANALSASGILDLPPDRLSELLRPAGCHTVKSRRLRAVCEWLKYGGGSGRVDALSTSELRSSLLTVHGVGQETADAILLYAFGRSVFVVDAYARRLFSRTGLIKGEETYRDIQAAVELTMGFSVQDYNEFHAVIVEHCKLACRKTPRCADCPIRCECRYSNHTVEQD